MKKELKDEDNKRRKQWARGDPRPNLHREFPFLSEFLTLMSAFSTLLKRESKIPFRKRR
jgi:hypothetical protein